MQIDRLVVELSRDPFNPEKNFRAAVEYDKINQIASAVSFYLRTAEYGYTTHPEYVYASLLRMSLCFERLKDRQATVLNNAMQALEYLPERPEAYFLVSRIHERAGQWQQCYTMAELGLTKVKDLPSLPASVEYYAPYCLLFEKAISAWWVGRQDESRRLLQRLEQMDIAPEYAYAVRNNLQRVGLNKEEKINPLEPVVMNYRKFFGEKAPLIFDIGTRDGNDANYLAKQLKAEKVYAIDANPLAIIKTRQAYPWMNIIETAISYYDGEHTFQQVDSGDANMDGCSSLYADKIAKEPQFEGKVNIIETPVKRMDTFIDEEGLIGAIDVVKVDVEGYTWEVLQGFGSRLSSVRVFHLETEKEPTHANHKNSKEIEEFLTDKGFALVDISYEGSNGINGGIEDQVWVNKSLVTRNRDCFF